MFRRLLPLLPLLALLALPAGAAAVPTRIAPTPSLEEPPASPSVVLRKAEAARSGRTSAGDEDLTMLLRKLAVALPRLSGNERDRAERLLARPTRGQSTEADADGEYGVAEQPLVCSAHFCIHYVATTRDRAAPEYVQTMTAVFEHVYEVENVQMGWQAAKSDGARGCPARAPECMNKTDVYIKDIGDDGLYGYAAADPNQDTYKQYAYLVLDNDYAEPLFRETYPDGALKPMQVTAAHEYNHVLQFGYSVAQETWMYEASSSWVEEKVYPDINDYFQYLESWAQLTVLPLTNEVGASQEYTGKLYGSAVWNHWLDFHFTQDSIRGAWENALRVRPRGFSPAAYDVSLRGRGSGYFKAFTAFAADTAEWRAASSVFPDRAAYPDVRRVRDNRGRAFRLGADGAGGVAPLLHSSYALIDVAPSSAAQVKLVANMPRGARGAVALVGRVGDPVGGTAGVLLKRLRNGGTGTVTLDNPAQFERITAVLVNGDGRTTGRATGADWEWIGDDDTDDDGIPDNGPPISAWISTDFSAPTLEHRSPSRDKRGVSRRASVKLDFSERMAFANTRTAVLRGPGKRKVRVRVDTASGGRSLALRPRAKLRPRTRYTVTLSSDVTDRGGNPLPAGSRTWQFVTGR